MSAHPQPTEVPPPVAMLQMVQGFWMSRALYAAAKLALPDLIKDSAKTSDELAQATGTHPSSLYRLLRALASVGVFDENGHGFALTPLGATLRSDAPGSLRDFVIEELGENHYPAWEKLLHSVQTGDTAFNHVFGIDKWQYMAQHPDQAEIFDAAMAGFSSGVSAAIVGAYDFSSSKTVVDLGGGDGILLSAILKANPNLRGILADRPHVADAAHRRFGAEALSARCQAVHCDFFQHVPAADTYILKWIIHDWDDERSVAILSNCRKAMADPGRVLIVEAVLEPGRNSSFAKFVDLNMLVMTGGRERTESEYRALIHSAGLQLNRIIPTHSAMSIIEAVRA